MGRPHRHLEAGAFYHVGIRGNDHAPIVVDDGDRIVFFHILRRVERRYGWRTHVRCLMGTTTTSSSRPRCRTSTRECGT